MHKNNAKLFLLFSRKYIYLSHNNNEKQTIYKTDEAILVYSLRSNLQSLRHEWICKRKTGLDSVICGSRLLIIPEVERSMMQLKAISLEETWDVGHRKLQEESGPRF